MKFQFMPPTWKDDMYCMTPLRAKQILSHIMKVYGLNQNDVYYMTWLPKATISSIMNDTIYEVPRKYADMIVDFFKGLHPNNVVYLRAQRDWLQRLIYYLSKGDINYTVQKNLKRIMIAHREEWSRREWSILDLVDMEKMKWSCWEFYYNKNFLDRVLDPKCNYFKFNVKKPKTNESLANKCLKLFLRNFNEFPSDLYNKYLRLEIKYDPKDRLKSPAQKRVDLYKRKDFLFCF